MAAWAGGAWALRCMEEHVLWPAKYREFAEALGVRWLTGVLIAGPPGVGKTHLAKCACAMAKCEYTVLSAASDMGMGFVGDAEEAVRKTFRDAQRAAAEAPSKTHVLLIEDIDTLCPRRDGLGVQPHELRMVAQFLSLLDGVSSEALPNGARLAVVATTSRPFDVDDAARRAGRLERDIVLAPPNREERGDILRLLLRHHGSDERLASAVAQQTPGYTPADLVELVRHTARLGDDWRAALSLVRPSALRGIAVETDGGGADDVVTLDDADADAQRALRRAILLPFQQPRAMARLGVRPARGVLLHGPPGTGKTTLARAAARHARRPLIAMSGADLFAAHVGEGEANLRDAFRRAREAAPCILLIDEIDAVGGAARQRGTAGGGAPGAGERLLTTLLAEMDGLGAKVAEEAAFAPAPIVVACTNRPDVLDAALLRGGRFDEVVYIGPPSEEARERALRVHSAGMTLADDVDLQELVRRTEGFTGADVASLCRQAGMCALDDEGADAVAAVHFNAALECTRQSVTRETCARFERWQADRSSSITLLGV